VRGSLFDTDRRTIQLLDLLRAFLSRDHEALAVEEKNPGKLDLQACFKAQRPGCVAKEEIDLPGLQCGEAGRCLERYKFNFRRVPDHRCRHRPAEVHIESGPASGGIPLRKAGNPLTHSAAQYAPGLDGIESLPGKSGSSLESDRKQHRQDRQHKKTLNGCHRFNPLSCPPASGISVQGFASSSRMVAAISPLNRPSARLCAATSSA